MFPHRRIKEDVAKSIPKKEETIIDVELTSVQKQYYRAILEKNRHFLYRGCEKKNLPSLINIEMQLRKVCNHPFLVSGVEDKEFDAVEHAVLRDLQPQERERPVLNLPNILFLYYSPRP